MFEVWQQSTLGAGAAGVPAVEAEVTVVAQPSPLAVSLDGPAGTVAADEDLVLTGHWTRGPSVLGNPVVDLHLFCWTLPSLLPCARSAPEATSAPGNHSVQWGDTLGDSDEGSCCVEKGSGLGVVPAALLQVCPFSTDAEETKQHTIIASSATNFWITMATKLRVCY